MNELAAGIIGIYFIAVAIKGNGSEAYNLLGEEVKGFAPWIAAVIVIALIGSNKESKPFVMPFIGLALLAFVLKNEQKLTANVTALYDYVNGKKTNG